MKESRLRRTIIALTCLLFFVLGIAVGMNINFAKADEVKVTTCLIKSLGVWSEWENCEVHTEYAIVK